MRLNKYPAHRLISGNITALFATARPSIQLRVTCSGQTAYLIVVTAPGVRHHLIVLPDKICLTDVLAHLYSWPQHQCAFMMYADCCQPYQCTNLGMLPDQVTEAREHHLSSRQVELSGRQANDISPEDQSFELAQLCREGLKRARMSGCCLMYTVKQSKGKISSALLKTSQVLCTITVSTYEVDNIGDVLQGQMLCHIWHVSKPAGKTHQMLTPKK